MPGYSSPCAVCSSITWLLDGGTSLTHTACLLDAVSYHITVSLNQSVKQATNKQVNQLFCIPVFQTCHDQPMFRSSNQQTELLTAVTACDGIVVHYDFLAGSIFRV